MQSMQTSGSQLLRAEQSSKPTPQLNQVNRFGKLDGAYDNKLSYLRVNLASFKLNSNLKKYTKGSTDFLIKLNLLLKNKIKVKPLHSAQLCTLTII